MYACPFGAPQFPKNGVFESRGAMDKCTFCAGGPEETNSDEEYRLYGQNRIAEGKVPMCASMCSTKALLAGSSEEVSNIITHRATVRGENIPNAVPNVWKTAYGN